MATKNTKTTALARWDEELAKQAEVAAGMATAAGGQFFSVQGGVLQWKGSPLPGNQVAAVVVSHILENVYYADKFDPDNPSPPHCFAIGTKERELVPHEAAVEAGTALEGPCMSCPNNEWGSAETGRGKACRNSRKLALLAAGSFSHQDKLELIDDEGHFESAELGLLRLPVTSIQAFDSFVQKVHGSLKLNGKPMPPCGVVARIKVVADPKTQFKVTFDALSEVPKGLLPLVAGRIAEANRLLTQPYQMLSEEERAAAAKPAKSRAAQKPGRSARKY